MHIDINCDMGEGIGNDEDIMPYITSANIACGYHAGNEETIRTTALLAKNHGVHVGVHPSFRDRENFGRIEVGCSPEEVYTLVSEQLQLFQQVVNAWDIAIHHVKPHGALYNMAARDAKLAQAVCSAVKDFDRRLLLFGLSGSHLINEANKLGLTCMQEVFADRTYQEDGSLTPRSKPNALIEDEEAAVKQVLQMVNEKKVTTITGKPLPIQADTVCIHGDGPHAILFAKRLHAALQKFIG